MSQQITLNIVLDLNMAMSLGSNSSPNFLEDQPDRFEVMAIDGHDDVHACDVEPLTAEPFSRGEMTWCGTISDALLLRAFEQGCGHQTAMLWDLVTADIRLPAGGFEDAYVVLSTRPWPRPRHS